MAELYNAAKSVPAVLAAEQLLEGQVRDFAKKYLEELMQGQGFPLKDMKRKFGKDSLSYVFETSSTQLELAFVFAKTTEGEYKPHLRINYWVRGWGALYEPQPQGGTHEVDLENLGKSVAEGIEKFRKEKETWHDTSK